MIIYKNRIRKLVFTILTLITASVFAEDPTVILDGKRDFTIDDVAENTILNEGTIFYPFPHQGFSIKLEAQPVIEFPGTYILTGINNHNNKIQVRLEGNGWRPDISNPSIMTLTSQEQSVKFKIVLSKNTKIPMDKFNFNIKAIAITQ